MPVFPSGATFPPHWNDSSAKLATFPTCCVSTVACVLSHEWLFRMLAATSHRLKYLFPEAPIFSVCLTLLLAMLQELLVRMTKDFGNCSTFARDTWIFQTSWEVYSVRRALLSINSMQCWTTSKPETPKSPSASPPSTMKSTQWEGWRMSWFHQMWKYLKEQDQLKKTIYAGSEDPTEHSPETPLN